MEVPEKKHIENKIAELIAITDCNLLVIGGLSQHLSNSDVQTLEVKRQNGGGLVQAKAFYDIMVMKANSYDDLVAVLEETKQQAPANILKELRKGTTQGAVKPATQQQSNCERLVVGKEEPCTFLAVRDVMKGSGGKLWAKLLDLATSLRIPDDDLFSINSGLSKDTITRPGALLEILESWRSRHSSNATLGSLIMALESNDLFDCAEALRTHFRGS